MHRLTTVLIQDGRSNRADYALRRQDAAEVAHGIPIHNTNIVASVELFLSNRSPSFGE